MAFIEPSTSPAPIAVPVAVQAANLVMALKRQGNQVFAQELAAFKNAYNTVWNNSNPALTPQVMFAALGKDAASALAQSYVTYVHLTTIVPGCVAASYGAIPAGRTITANADGTVTVNS